GSDLPERPAEEGLRLPVSDNAVPKLCPDCGHILLPYHVGHALNFTLDHCGHCGGTWFDKNEWEILKSRNLHDDIHFIFSHVWQAEVFHEERRQAHERLLLEKFGAE